MAVILDHLEFIYGKSVARQVYPRILELLRKYEKPHGAVVSRPPRLSLSEGDAVLISYADQVQESGKPPLQVLSDFLQKHLKETIGGLHLLPFYPSSSDDGFAVIDWFAVDPLLGTWEDIEAAGGSFDLMFDAVFNHLSASSRWFEGFLGNEPEFRDFFVSVEGEPDLSRVVRPRALPLLTEFEGAAGTRIVWTTFSADQVDLNFRNPQVLLAALEALLFYVSKGARFIRLDAIAYLWKEIGTTCIHLPQTHRIIQLMRAVLDQSAPEAVLITETNVPHSDNISYFGDGRNEAQLVYNFALPPLVLHTLATGNASVLSRWAASLRLPSDGVTFFNFLASHDGIGLNPARGLLSPTEIDSLIQRTQKHGGFVSYKHNSDGSRSAYELNISYFDALSNPNNHSEPIETQIARFAVAHAIMLSLAGMPGIYFHSLFGSRNDRLGAEASGIPRRINRQKFSRSELEQELADRSGVRARVLSHLCDLLRTRREQPALAPGASQQILPVDERAFVVLRADPGTNQRVLCLHNVTDQTVSLSIELAGISEAKTWAQLPGKRTLQVQSNGTLAVELAPYQALWAKHPL